MTSQTDEAKLAFQNLMKKIVAAAKEINERTIPAERYAPPEMQQNNNLEDYYSSSSDSEDDSLTAEGYVEAFAENRCCH